MWVFGIDMTSTASDMGIWYSELPPPPAFSATPALLTFAKGGPYAVDVEQGGQPTTRDLTITNINGSGVTITALDFYGPSAGDFSLVSPPALPLTLAPSESRQLTVKFAPKEDAPTLGLVATLQIIAGDPTHPVGTVTLTGDTVPVELSMFEAD